MERADEAGVEVGEAAGGVEDFAGFGAAEAESEGVDGEVAAEEVVADRRRGDGGKSAGAGVRLGAGGDEVEVKTGDADGGCEEGWVSDGATACRLGKLAGESHCVAFDRDVGVERGAFEEEVAERAADEINGNGVALSDGEELVEEAARAGGEGAHEFSDEIRVSHNSSAYRRVLP